jgi:CHASE2 domain-containing sensor protein
MEFFTVITSIIDPVRILVIFVTLVMYTEMSKSPNTPFIVIFTTIFSAGIAWYSYSLITGIYQPMSVLAIGLGASFFVTMLMSKTLFKNVLCPPKEKNEVQKQS